MVDLLWDCAVPGVPASLQGSGAKRADWKRRVGEAATPRWSAGEPPVDVPVAMLVAFLHDGQPIDVDNMLKPTLDGLNGIAYLDDALIEQVTGVRWDLARGLQVDRVSPVLAGAISTAIGGGGPFVYLRLSSPVGLEELL